MPKADFSQVLILMSHPLMVPSFHVSEKGYHLRETIHRKVTASQVIAPKNKMARTIMKNHISEKLITCSNEQKEKRRKLEKFKSSLVSKFARLRTGFEILT